MKALVKIQAQPATGFRLGRALTIPLMIGLCAVLMPAAGLAGEISIDADFPGGNILVQQVAGDTVFVAPDQRDTATNQWWFYWNFRLKAPPQKPVTIVFTGKNPIGVRGPAMSGDDGVTWQWLGADGVTFGQHNGQPAWSFVACVPAGQTAVRYAFCPQYLESHLNAWLDKHQVATALHIDTLCRTRQGRAVELLRAGCLDPQRVRGVVLLTSRHHCCEIMATYALEGLLDAVLADDEIGRQWRARWEVIAIPFMDKDGVENGDQGKYRQPHDHNRDYNPQPLYPEVAALMKLGAALQGRVVAALDLHCPHIRGEWNDRAYFVGGPEQRLWDKERAFAAVLAQVQQGPIKFRQQDCIPYGTGWNTKSNFSQGRSSTEWARATFPQAQLAACMEIAYADALGIEVNAASARALGRDLANALLEHLSGSYVDKK